jgi:hypothetical protein
MELRHDKLGPRVVKSLESRNFEAWYFQDASLALEKLFSLIPKTDTVSWGGSLTLAELNITAMAVEKGYKVIDRDKAQSQEERAELMRQTLLCDTFITGTNAISEDGQLLNIDGFGNRVAAMIFGPRQVIVVAGMNKVTKNLEAALNRTRNLAAPVNIQRFPDVKTPCNETGTCSDCKSAECLCNYLVQIRSCKPKGRIKVILVGKDLGL